MCHCEISQGVIVTWFIHDDFLAAETERYFLSQLRNRFEISVKSLNLYLALYIGASRTTIVRWERIGLAMLVTSCSDSESRVRGEMEIAFIVSFL